MIVETSQAKISRGFTLIELLLAIFIFSIVVSAVYGSYRATFHVVNGTQEKMEIAEKAHFVLERISDDLTSIVQGEGGYLLGEKHDSAGLRGDSLSFISAVHIGLTKGEARYGYSEIIYDVEADEETGLLNLYRSGSRLFPSQEDKENKGYNEDKENVLRYLFCDGLKEVRFSYQGGEEGESDEWQSAEEDSTNTNEVTHHFPVMVTMVLRFAETVESESVQIFTTSVAMPVAHEKK